MAQPMRRQISKDIAKERVGILIANALKEAHANEKIANEQAYLAEENCHAVTRETGL